jgi:hypothetical protein
MEKSKIIITEDDKIKAEAFDLLMNCEKEFSVLCQCYDKLKDTSQPEWCAIIIKQACKNALDLAMKDKVNIWIGN